MNTGVETESFTMKTAVITGITGQDGAYLARFLLDKNYVVYGAFRRSSSSNFWRIQTLGVLNHPNFKLYEHDITDISSSIKMLEKTQPDELYNLAAQSFVSTSFEQPIATSEITGLAVLNLLEAIRIVNHKIKFYQASTSEMFGKVQTIPQTEETPFYPRSPYGVAKLYAHWMTINYRESFGLFAANGILFNHESPLRGKEFVTRKITDGMAKIALGQMACLELGNLDSKRDWGYAEEYVAAMWAMLQQPQPDTYVLATQRAESVRAFVELSAKAAGITIRFEHHGEKEIGIDCETNRVIVRVNPQFFRPTEVDLLIGNPEKAQKTLGWSPKTSLETLCSMMVNADLQRNREGFLY